MPVDFARGVMGGGGGASPQKPKILKIKRNEGFYLKLIFFTFFAGLPKTISLLSNSLKIITSAPQLPENK